MHENSLAAYSEGNRSGGLSDRAARILGVVRHRGLCTDRQIKDALGFDDMNAVRPRITELIKANYLEEFDSISDPVTGRKARRVRLKVAPVDPVPMVQQNLFELPTPSCV